MPIDLHSLVTSVSNNVFGSPFLNNLFHNSIFVAFLISIIMVLLIMFMYPAKKGTSIGVVLRMFMYMLLGSAVVIFLHDGVVKYKIQKEQSAARDSAFTGGFSKLGGSDPVYGSMYKPVMPVTAGITNVNDTNADSDSDSDSDEEIDSELMMKNGPNDKPKHGESSIQDVSAEMSTTINEILKHNVLTGPKPVKVGGNMFK